MKIYSTANEIIMENEYISLCVNKACEATSLVYKPTGTECLETLRKMPLFSATQNRFYNNELKLTYPNKRTVFSANRVRVDGDRLIVGFELVPYEAVISVRLAKRYIAFELEDFSVDNGMYNGLLMDLPPVVELRLIQLPVKERGAFGEWLNVAFDGNVAVNVIATSPHARIDSSEERGFRVMTADAVDDIRLRGCGAAIIVSRTDELLDAIDALEEDYNLPRGVKSRRCDMINASAYWTSEIYPDNVDEHIEYAKKGGFRLMLIYYSSIVKEGELYSLCGDYDINSRFPNGIEDLRAMLQKIKAEGITPGLHFLHTHIGLKSRYATPVADHRLNLTKRFTLAKPLENDDTVMYVDQNPEGTTLKDGCRVIRCDGELISYENYVSEYPYRFVGCRRGYNGTYAAEHARGCACGILDVSEFGGTSVYLDQLTDLQDEIADKIAEIYHAGFEYVYFDGSEGTNAPFDFHIPNAQYRLYKKFKNEPLLSEGAAKSHFGWHMLSGGNAFDVFPTSVFKEKIAEFPAEQAPRMANDFTRLNFGWWAFSTDTQPDIYEYGTSRAAAWDCPGTMMANTHKFAENPRTDDILEVLRRWEDVRAKDWLTDEQKMALRNMAQEHILLVNESGDYELVAYDRIKDAANGNNEVSVFTFERNGKSCAVCWHTSGEGRLLLPLGIGKVTYRDELGAQPLEIETEDDGVVLPISKRRYVEATVSLEELTDAFRRAVLSDK